MKSLLILSAFFYSSISFAQGFGQTYENVNVMTCESEHGSVNANVSDQTFTATLISGDTSFEFSFEPISQEPEIDLEVGLMLNFLESGYDLFGSAVVSTDFSTFGTLAAVLEKNLEEGSSEYKIIYIEALMGAQFVFPMSCTFE